MKPLNILYVLFFISLLLFLPLGESSHEYGLVPQHETEVLYKVHGVQVQVTARAGEIDGGTRINMTVYRLDPSINNFTLVYDGQVTNEYTLQLKQRGYYLFSFVSSDLGRVILKDQFVPISSLIIVGIFTTIAVLLRLRDVMSVKIDY